jgi:2-methylaconitate cis-trans-isomerase PrpF
MPLFTAFEDFTSRTLNAFPTALQRLHFVSSLRTKAGKYSHWGMKRTFGRDRANEAIDRAHRELAIEILDTPIPQLHASAASIGLSHQESSEELGPNDWNGGAKEHLDYILASLSLLEQTSARASRPVS